MNSFQQEKNWMMPIVVSTGMVMGIDLEQRQVKLAQSMAAAAKALRDAFK